MPWIIPLAIMAVGAVSNIVSANKTKSALTKLQGQDPSYTESPEVAEQYGLAKNLLNARMPGYADAQQNIFANEANADTNIDNSATDSSQALALKAMAHANTNKSFENLGQADQQDYYNRLGNLNQATGAEASQENTAYQDSVRAWQDKVNISMGKGALSQQQGQTIINLGGAAASTGKFS